MLHEKLEIIKVMVEVVVLVLIDFSKTFDCMFHHILLQKLDSRCILQGCMYS